MQEICAGGYDDIVYGRSFDSLGQPFAISSGDTVSWPARAPHRVINGENLNVSLSTLHETAEDYDRVLEHRADYLLRTKAPWARALATAAGPAFKRNVYKVCERAALDKGRPLKEFSTRIRIDPSAPTGVREIPGGGRCLQSTRGWHRKPLPLERRVRTRKGQKQRTCDRRPERRSPADGILDSRSRGRLFNQLELQGTANRLTAPRCSAVSWH